MLVYLINLLFLYFSQDRLNQLIHELNQLRFPNQGRTFHGDIADFWLKNREYFEDLRKFVFDYMGRICEKQTDVLLNEAIFTPDRKSDLTKLIKTFFTQRHSAVEGIMVIFDL